MVIPFVKPLDITHTVVLGSPDNLKGDEEE
jgi:hypothetical protein